MTTDTNPPQFTTPRRIGGITRLAANELPHAPPAPVRAAVADHVQLNRYPDPRSATLVNALAEHLRTPSEQIMLGAGSSSILQRLTRIVCSSPDDAVLWTTPAFDAFDIFARQAGVRAQRVPHTGGDALDLDAVLAAVTPATRMIVVVNPHNPTGAVARTSALRAFLSSLDDNVTVVLDEAYRDFVTDPDVPDGVELAHAHWAAGHENIAVVRTFSKAHGLAGARVGYGVASTELARKVRDGAIPREISTTAQVAGVAALKSRTSTDRNISRVVAERTRVVAELRRIGYAPGESHGNFLWLPLAEDAGRFAAHCYDDGVLVLDVADYGVRVTVGTPTDNDSFLRSAHTWITGRPRSAKPTLSPGNKEKR
ncbi:aminotransferase [Amycolatopsis sp. WAC 01375]|uniref:aminotransferase class I/II-fold pyridoxal phosphate-dependent enzyme n=1 Tax=Amycolatopsis sp. WAC 01375 TaxID=2203194 RepID=UPI000F7AFE1C|nr:aminotransferase class I/II-fold pyridoxal phosphate-dependent enzyme [Amycolatopsis sp. WAC 01375]RSM80593.1 aminotransferase [Amycolatopsis sp. WAC 01375]